MGIVTIAAALSPRCPSSVCGADDSCRPHQTACARQLARRCNPAPRAVLCPTYPGWPSNAATLCGRAAITCEQSLILAAYLRHTEPSRLLKACRLEAAETLRSSKSEDEFFVANCETTHRHWLLDDSLSPKKRSAHSFELSGFRGNVSAPAVITLLLYVKSRQDHCAPARSVRAGREPRQGRRRSASSCARPFGWNGAQSHRPAARP